MNRPAAFQAVTLRPAAPKDEQFLFEVYASTRQSELDQVDWDDSQREVFLRMQFGMQQRIYSKAEQSIILSDGRPAGRLIVTRNAEEIRLADIALLPEFRGMGAGTSLIKDLMNEADLAGKPLRLQVEKSNAGAKRLYEQLGFSSTGESGTHFQMEYGKR